MRRLSEPEAEIYRTEGALPSSRLPLLAAQDGGGSGLAENFGAKNSFRKRKFYFPLSSILWRDSAAARLNVSNRGVRDAKDCGKLALSEAMLGSVFAERVCFHSATHRSIYFNEIQDVARYFSKLPTVAL